MEGWIRTDKDSKTISGEVTVQLSGSHSKGRIIATVAFHDMTPERFACIHEDMKIVAQKLISGVAAHAIDC